MSGYHCPVCAVPAGEDFCQACGWTRVPPPTRSAVEVIQERLEGLRAGKAVVDQYFGSKPWLAQLETPQDGEIAGLEFALRALGVEP